MSDTPTYVEPSEIQPSEDELVEKFKERFEVILGAVEVRIIHAIAMAQMDPSCTFARNNRVYVFMNGKDLAIKASTQERPFWKSINILVDAGFLEIERADFIFNGNRNCYALCYPFLHQWLKNPHYTRRVARADASWRMPMVADMTASTGLDLIPHYKKRPGRFAKRKGVLNHTRKKQRANFITNIQKGTDVPFLRQHYAPKKASKDGESSSEKVSDDTDSLRSITFPRNLFFNKTPTELYIKKLYLHHINENTKNSIETFKKETLKYKKSYEQLNGSEIYDLSIHWLTCFKEAGGRVKFNKPPTLLAKYLGQLFKKGIISSQKELEEHAKCVGGRFKWTRDNLKNALSFKAATLFKKGYAMTEEDKKAWEDYEKWEAWTTQEVANELMATYSYPEPPVMTDPPSEYVDACVEAYEAQKRSDWKRACVEAGHRHMRENGDKQLAEIKKYEEMPAEEKFTDEHWKALLLGIKESSQASKNKTDPTVDSAEFDTNITSGIASNHAVHVKTCVNDLDLKPHDVYHQTIGNLSNKDHDVWQERKPNISAPKSCKSVGQYCENIFKTLPQSPRIRSEFDISCLIS